MSLQIGSSQTQTPIVVQSKANFDKASTKRVRTLNEKEPEAPTKVKLGVFATTLAGVCAAMLLTFKHNSKPIEVKNLKDFVNGFKKIEYDDEKHDIEKLVGRLAIGSVTGGLVGGAIFDKKENMKAKVRESIIQLVGNIATPLAFVAGGGRLFKKFAAPKVIKALNLKSEVAQKVPQVVASTGLLIAAIFAGNSVGNFINQKLFNIDDKRKIKLSDMSPHIDDACMSVSLVAPENKTISKFIPAALMVAGYSVGTTQEKPERVAAIKENAVQAEQKSNA